ncbi:hypothetical protein HB364_14600 [Pseudoflavitalea sp. X16]|uniref:hypothetical protein n=1 Tax=Paraflavitalea devenefica TaxID=2716334 RepID=UPI00141E198F|nr:hypothetical protein [Paraflavitalea devenefica]NII26318.1 hypothetical protein [Paraflavitalea devenefica]
MNTQNKRDAGSRNGDQLMIPAAVPVARPHQEKDQPEVTVYRSIPAGAAKPAPAALPLFMDAPLYKARDYDPL